MGWGIVASLAENKKCEIIQVLGFLGPWRDSNAGGLSVGKEQEEVKLGGNQEHLHEVLIHEFCSRQRKPPEKLR